MSSKVRDHERQGRDHERQGRDHERQGRDHERQGRDHERQGGAMDATIRANVFLVVLVILEISSCSYSIFHTGLFLRFIFNIGD